MIYKIKTGSSDISIITTCLARRVQFKKNHLAYSSFYVTIKQKGWSKDPGPPSGGDIPRHFLFTEITSMKKILSIFIDESGDFGDYDNKAPYYLVAMVLHDQQIDITSEINNLDQRISDLGFPPHAIHVGPIIRKESIYERYDDPVARKSLLNALYHFARRIDIKYLCPSIKKSECSDFIQLNAKLSREISSQIRNNYEYFNGFDQIIVYYDNGQNELTKILTSVFNTLFTNVEFRRVKPSDYKLFQVADLICTWELLALKAEDKTFTKSETEMFDSPREFLRNRYKLISKKKL